MTEYVDIALSDLVLSRSDKTIIELPVFRYYVFIKPTSRFFETPKSVRWVGGSPVRAVKEAVAQLLPEAEPAAALARGAGRGAAQEGDHLDLNRFFILSTNLTYNHEYSQRYFFSFTSTEHKKLKAYNVSNFSDNRVKRHSLPWASRDYQCFDAYPPL